MKILIVSSFLLFEHTRFGGSKRLFYFAEALKKVAKVDLICIDGCKEISTCMSVPDGFNNYMTIIRQEKRDLVSRLFYSDLELKANKYEGIDDVFKFINNNTYDAVLCAFPLSIDFIPFLYTKNKNITYLEDDLSFEKLNNIIKLSNFYSFYYLIKQFKLFQLLSFYKKKLKNVSKFICISEQEKIIVKKRFPNIDVQIIKYGIKMDVPALLSKEKTFSLGFIGNYKHQPNTDAILYFFNLIFPVLDRRYTIIVAGQNIPTDIRDRFKDEQSVLFMENPENLMDFYNKVDVFINPIISGRGLRTKLIEAALYGKPIVSTTLGAEGVEDLRILISDDPEQFVINIDNLFSNDEQYNQIIDYNVVIVKNNYSIEQIGKKLMNVLKM